MRYAFVMAALLAGCAPSEPPRDLQAELRAAYQTAEDGFYDRHPRLHASDQMECRAAAKLVRGGIMAQYGYREDCLEARDLRRQGR